MKLDREADPDSRATAAAQCLGQCQQKKWHTITKHLQCGLTMLSKLSCRKQFVK